MPRISGSALLWPLILAQAAMGQVPKNSRWQPAGQRDATGAIALPLDFGELAWKPRPMRSLSMEMLEGFRWNDGGAAAGDELDDPRPEGEAVPLDLQGPINVNSIAIRNKAFDLWVFGESTGEKRAKWLAGALSVRMATAKDRGLAAEEQARLMLAGRGDIKRFLDRVEEQRAMFETIRRDYRKGRTFIQQLAPLSDEFCQGPFGEGSLFAKVLAKIEKERGAAR